MTIVTLSGPQAEQTFKSLKKQEGILPQNAKFINKTREQAKEDGARIAKDYRDAFQITMFIGGCTGAIAAACAVFSFAPLGMFVGLTAGLTAISWGILAARHHELIRNGFDTDTSSRLVEGIGIAALSGVIVFLAVCYIAAIFAGKGEGGGCGSWGSGFCCGYMLGGGPSFRYPSTINYNDETPRQNTRDIYYLNDPVFTRPEGA